MSEFSLGKMIGVASGIAVGLIIVILYRLFVVKKKCANEYDERQIIARGKAYKASFFTMLIGSTLVALFGSYIKTVIGIPTQIVCVLAIGIMVYAIYSIVKDAYIGLNESAVRFMIIGFLLGIVNIIGGIRFLTTGTVDLASEDPTSILNLILGTMLLAVSSALFIKTRLADKEED